MCVSCCIILSMVMMMNDIDDGHFHNKCFIFLYVCLCVCACVYVENVI